MSEQDMRVLVVIDPEELFQQHKFSPEQMRDALGKLEAQVEEKRLIAWTTAIASPQSEEARKLYVGLCREQGRIMTAFNRWRAAHPENEE